MKTSATGSKAEEKFDHCIDQMQTVFYSLNTMIKSNNNEYLQDELNEKVLRNQSLQREILSSDRCAHFGRKLQRRDVHDD